MTTQALILAGGQGTRLRPLTAHKPKPLVEVAGRPFLAHLLQMLAKEGITDVVLLTGYRGKEIEEYVSDGSRFGLSVKYSAGAVAWETGKRVREAAPLLHDEFMLLYCDNYWPMNLRRMRNQFHAKNLLGMVTVYENGDGFTKDNIKVNDGMVVQYDKTRTAPGLKGVEIGFYFLKKSVVQLIPQGNPSFEATVLPKLIEQRQLAAYVDGHPYISISTPQRLERAERFFGKRKVVFLDRDGVICRKAAKAQYITNPDGFEFLPGVLDALKAVTDAGFEIMIITNQPGIGRKMMTEEDLRQVHDKMTAACAERGIGRLTIYCCPHGWHEDCVCHKPKPGLLHQAAREHHLLLPRYTMVGDDERDIQAGQAAGCKTILIGQQPEATEADAVCADLPEAVELILQQETASAVK